MIFNLLDIDQEYLIEGDALLPELINQLIEEKKDPRIKVCFLGYTDIPVDKKLLIIRQYKGGPNDWIQQYSDEYIKNHANNMAERSQLLKAECQKYRIPYFDTSEDFAKTIDQVCEYLSSNSGVQY